MKENDKIFSLYESNKFYTLPDNEFVLFMKRVEDTAYKILCNRHKKKKGQLYEEMKSDDDLLDEFQSIQLDIVERQGIEPDEYMKFLDRLDKIQINPNKNSKIPYTEDPPSSGDEWKGNWE